ncbi:MAG: glycosyltransferase [Flavobacteriales bacterium]|jgi:hypothetical protein|nr:glycosyltransferase [Flavobacteriales bacterium]MBK6882855.1 glycosyltransferase [Flavobacteriales bacterium]MBK7101848.1 glycosyltransferase [Flavobacteriales bacterium]MBK7114196.1 glycosyltransferase [Flavobacteriales bacterium]MBK7483751.1 glycosyltransferase [Flavobacteriales bacterium]
MEEGTGNETPLQAPQPRRILVLTYWSWDDALIQAYTLPYLRIMLKVLPAGSTIHVVTLEKGAFTAGAQVREPGIVGHAFRYEPFGVRGMRMIAILVWRSIALARAYKVDTVHCWCTPAGMIGYLVSVLTGRPLVIDSYEPHAEAMVENGTWTRRGIAFRTLFLFERLQTRRARAVLAAASGMRDYALRVYGHVPKEFHVKPACVDLEKFGSANVKRTDLVERFGLHGKRVLVYAGKFGGIYWDQEVFDFIRVAHDQWGEQLHVLLLTGHSEKELMPFMERAGLPRELFTIQRVPHAEVPDHMGLGDVALTPVRPVPTKRYCTPIKDGEYWALGLPVVITPGISDDSELIQRLGIGSVLVGNTQQAYERAIREIDALLAQNTRQALYERIRPVAEKYRHFRIAETAYSSIYGRTE